MHVSDGNDFPVVRELSRFDKNSGSWPERVLFNHRGVVVLICVLITAVLGWRMADVGVNASYEKMIPTSHPFIQNYLENKAELGAQGNSIRIAVVSKKGTILSKSYLETLRLISDEVLFLPGVDRSYMKSLWTPATRWLAVTEEGLDGGTVIPDTYDGSPESIAQVRTNIERSGEIGQLVAADFESTIIFVPLNQTDADGKPLDYKALSDELERIRAKYKSEDVDIHIVGFAKIVGDLIEGLEQVALFFIIAVMICSIMVWIFNRDFRSTALVVVCSNVAVVWQLGLLNLVGLDLDPYSMLVPFLVFAIGMSHGTQKMNGILQDIGRGTHKLVAARYTFRRLFLAGLTALLCDAVGFAVLMIIDIEVIRELAISASIGVAVLILTNLVLLPILLSYSGVSKRAAERALQADKAASAAEKPAIWRFFLLFTERKYALGVILGSVAIGIGSTIVALDLKIGDMDAGAPELRPDSRYNQDNAYFTSHYAASSDVFVVMVKTPEFKCAEYGTQQKVDELDVQLTQTAGVEGTDSLARLSRNLMVGMNEGHPSWYELIPNQSMLNAVLTRAPQGLFNRSCDLLSVYAYLKDHKADTLEGVVSTVEKFAVKNESSDFKILMAAGNSGIEAATNIVVRQSVIVIYLAVYGAIAVLCLVVFRSWRATLVALIPLVLTSILCKAIMVWLGIGLKVATLPVIALGVGIGVDYALYELSVMLAGMRQGQSLYEARYKALLFTGKIVLLTGLTLGVAVATWMFSSIKFQADMGILLAFMFIWNMVGALVLLPALSYFLLRPSSGLPNSTGTRASSAVG